MTYSPDPYDPTHGFATVFKNYVESRTDGKLRRRDISLKRFGVRNVSVWNLPEQERFTLTWRQSEA